MLRVKAFPDRNNKDIFNVWNLDDFDLIYDNVLAYWDEYQYEDEDDDENSEESKGEREKRKQREKEEKEQRIA